MSCKFTLGALFALIAWAQPSPFESKPARGAMPFANLVGTEVDNVDTTTGNLSVSIPLATLPSWRGGQSFGVSLVYNSAIWDIAPSWIDGPLVGEARVRVVKHELVAGTTGGWKYNFRNIGIEIESRVTDGGAICLTNNTPNEDSMRFYRVRVGLADGSQHVLHLRGHGTEHYGGTSDGYYAFDFNGKRSGCASVGPGAEIYPADLSGTMTYFSADGSYLKLEVEAAPNGPLQYWRLYLPDGTRIRGKGSYAEVIDDPNGNNITINDFCNDLECFDVSTYVQTVQTGSGVQTLNARTRQIEVHYNGGPWTYSTTDDIHYRGFQQGATQLLTTTVYWNNYAVNAASNPQRGYLCWYYPSLSNLQNTGACSLAGVYLRQVNRINLPTANGTYFFSYNDSGAASRGYGELKNFNTPYSGTYLYQYLSQNGAQLESYRDLTNPVVQRLRAAGVQNSEFLTWNYAWEPTKSTQTGPDGTNVFYFYDKTGASNWFRGLTWKTELSSGETVERLWARNAAPGVRTDNPPNNPYVFDERRTYAGISARTAYTIDRNGNRRSTSRYGWTSTVNGTGLPLRSETTTYAVPVSDQTAIAANYSTIATSPPAATPSPADDAYGYWQPHHTAPQNALFPGVWAFRRLISPKREEVAEGSTVRGITEYYYANVTARDYYGTIPNRDTAYLNGHVYTKRVWDAPVNTAPPGLSTLSNANAITTNYTYDDLGNQLSEALLDEGGNEIRKTVRTYGAVNGVVGLYPTKEETGFGLEKRTSTFVWDYDTGLRTSATDFDNSITQWFSYDRFGRPAGVINASLNQSTRAYNEPLFQTTDRADARTYGDLGSQTITQYETPGRPSYTQTTDTVSGQAIFSKMLYLRDNLSNRELVSNPFRAANPSSPPTDLGWQCTVRDPAGRVTKQMALKGDSPTASSLCATSTGPASTSRMTELLYGSGTLSTGGLARQVEQREYTGPTTFNTTRRLYDALDRLVEVQETVGPSFQTTARYTYDALGNLTAVWPQNRSFVYRTSSRLDSATNPETGTINYTYLRDGSLWKKGDAIANPRITYGYDSLGRMISKSFVGTEPAVGLSYYQSGDNNSAGQVGRLRNVFRASSALTTYLSYDAAGRVLQMKQDVDGAINTQVQPGYVISYQYFANGTPSRLTYPSGRAVNYEMDAVGRPTQVCNGLCTGLDHYADIAGATANESGYAPHGAISRLVMGNTVAESTTFNDLLQPSIFTAYKINSGTLLQLNLGYGTQGSNTGNILSQGIYTVNQSFNQTYSYTARNQLKSAEEKNSFTNQTTWSRAWDYDAFGNQWTTAMTPQDPDPTIPVSSTWFNPSNNQFTPGPNFTYNGVGELTKLFGWNYTYSGEGQMLTASNGTTRTYVYDGQNQRVKLIEPGGTTYFIYGADGAVLAEYSTAPLTGPGGRQYLTSDWLGSTRLTTDFAGNVTSRRDYFPFGKSVEGAIGSRGASYESATPTTQLFTSKERDAETRLDYFGARYMSAAQGRFTSPDVPLLDQQPGDPQSWNLYSYVRNNPLIFTDPTGNDCVYVNSGGNGVGSVDNQIGSTQCGKAGGYWVDGTVTDARFAYGSLILTGTTNGENRTSASYGLGPDPGLMALQRGTQLAEPGVRLAAAGTAAVVGGAFVGVAYGGWAGGTALTTLSIPVATLPPLVSNPTLQGIVNKLFQASDKLPGGTAGAVRYERLTGDLMSPSGHSGKAQEVIVAVWNLMKSGKLTLNDQIVGRQIIQQLSDALKTQPRK